MNRRDMIALLGGAAAWPVAARAQQGGRVRRIGVLMGGAENNVASQGLAAFQVALRKLGWIEGRNVEFDVRWAGANGERRQAYAAEIVGRAPDVILANTGPVARAVQQETTRIQEYKNTDRSRGQRRHRRGRHCEGPRTSQIGRAHV